MEITTKTPAPVRVPLMRKSRKTKQDEVVGHALIDAQDAHLVAGFRWGMLVGRKTSYAYRQEHIKGTASGNRVYYMHRVILGLPQGTGHAIEADHLNFDGLDNRRSNLRVVTREEQNQSRRIFKNNKSGEVGISHRGEGRGNPWEVRLVRNHQVLIAKTFPTKTEAIAARDEALALYESKREQVSA